MSNAQLWIAAAEIGAFFSLIALAMYLVVIGADFFNFAMGPYAMVAAISMSWLIVDHGVALWLAVAAGIVLAVLLSLATEILVIRPVQQRSGRGELPALVAVTAVLFGVQQLAGTVFGRTPLPGQNLFDIEPFGIGATRISGATAILIGGTVVIFALTAWWLHASSVGRLLRAVGDNPDAARILGLPVARIRLVAFAVAGVIAALAGILFAPKSGVQFTSGLSWTLTAFLALVIGGTGRAWAPLLGGFILGCAQVFAPYYFGASAAQTAILVIALGFFALRPEGMITRKVRV